MDGLAEMHLEAILGFAPPKPLTDDDSYKILTAIINEVNRELKHARNK